MPQVPEPHTSIMLDLKNISKSFGTPGQTNFRQVLKELSFQMGEGESVAILGPSGSGKTTLLNIIGSLDFPDSGEFLFKKRDVRSFNSHDLDKFRNLEIGFVFQFHHLFPQCSLLENILIPTILIKDKSEKKKIYSRAEILLKRVGIWDHKDKLPGNMSGGECQRAALVRAMINSPSLLLADEPSGALDSKNAGNIAELLIDLNKNHGLSLLVVTHSPELAGRMQKTYQLVDGKLVLN